MLKRLVSIATHRLQELPILVLMPHSRCNCRCVMCDIWKANQEKREITVEELEKHLRSFEKLGVKQVALSGGEALMHSNLWKFCEALASIGVKISLLTTGVTLKNHAHEVVQHCDELIISLDGPRDVHNAIRNIPGGFEKIAEGIKTVKSISPTFRVTARTVLQKRNFRELPVIIQTAKQLGFDQISFLAADVSSTAFNRPQPWEEEKVSEVALSLEESSELEELIEKSFLDLKSEEEKKFIAESEEKLLDICNYYRALTIGSDFPEKKCNAPWVSAVIESNGDVLPCFFHKPYGNIFKNDFEEIINSKESIAFRHGLDIGENPICQRCVCSLYVPVINFH